CCRTGKNDLGRSMDDGFEIFKKYFTHLVQSKLFSSLVNVTLHHFTEQLTVFPSNWTNLPSNWVIFRLTRPFSHPADQPNRLSNQLNSATCLYSAPAPNKTW